jgi:hypothetical protein
MTHIEQAIKEAVENGGFMPFASIVPPRPWISEKMDFDTLAIYDGDPELSARRGSVGISRTLINPSFWQALGRARDWGEECSICSAQTERVEKDIAERGDSECAEPWQNHIMYPYWKYHWKSLIDHLAAGKDAESFFANL